MPSLHYLDWIICIGYVIVVIAVGFWCAQRQHTNEDYFVGGRNMNWGVVGLSIFATAFSSLSFVGLPREAAYNDYHLFLAILLIPLCVVPVVGYLFVPVFHRLRVTSAYEYLERRFCRSVRLIASLLFSLAALFWMATMLYAVAIIVQAVLGLSERQLIWAVVILGAFTAAYTVIGGFEAVIWTDVMQSVTLGAGTLIVLLVTVTAMDQGWLTVWETGLEHGKFQMFSTEIDFVSSSGTLIGAVALGLFSFLAIYGVQQPNVQRYVAMPSVAEARRALLLNGILVAGIGFLFFAVGTAIFAYYQEFPPAGTVEVSGLPKLPKQDQLLPHFILTEIPFPGLMGALLAGLFAAAMSSVDSGINSLAALLVCDWLSGRRLKLRTSQLVCALFGLAVVGLALLVPHLGSNVYSIILKIEGTLVGPILGVFLLGLLVRRANATGALVGLLAGVAASLLLSVDGTVGHWWYGAFTCIPTFVVGVICSLFSPPPQRAELDGLVYRRSGF